MSQDDQQVSSTAEEVSAEVAVTSEGSESEVPSSQEQQASNDSQEVSSSNNSQGQEQQPEPPVLPDSQGSQDSQGEQVNGSEDEGTSLRFSSQENDYDVFSQGSARYSIPSMSPPPNRSGSTSPKINLDGFVAETQLSLRFSQDSQDSAHSSQSADET